MKDRSSSSCAGGKFAAVGGYRNRSDRYCAHLGAELNLLNAWAKETIVHILFLHSTKPRTGFDSVKAEEGQAMVHIPIDSGPTSTHRQLFYLSLFFFFLTGQGSRGK